MERRLAQLKQHRARERAEIEHIEKQIKNIFENYKQLQNINVEVGNYFNKEEALKLLEDCKKSYQG